MTRELRVQGSWFFLGLGFRIQGCILLESPSFLHSHFLMPHPLIRVHHIITAGIDRASQRTCETVLPGRLLPDAYTTNTSDTTAAHSIASSLIATATTISTLIVSKLSSLISYITKRVSYPSSLASLH